MSNEIEVQMQSLLKRSWGVISNENRRRNGIQLILKSGLMMIMFSVKHEGKTDW